MKFLAVLLSILLTTLTMSRAVSHPAIVSPVSKVLPKGMPANCLMLKPKLMAQQHGNPGHHEPPPGWHCAHGKGDDAKDACTCHRECVDEEVPDANGGSHTQTRVKEDPKCDSFCYQDHCACGLHNCD